MYEMFSRKLTCAGPIQPRRLVRRHWQIIPTGNGERQALNDAVLARSEHAHPKAS